MVRPTPALKAFLSCAMACCLAAFVSQRLPTAAGSDGMACYQDGFRIANGSKWSPSSIPSNFSGHVQNPRCLTCSCLNGEVECEDLRPTCPPTPCPLEQRMLPRWACCTFCARPGSDISSGSGRAPVDVHEDCWDELGRLRQHGQCWNITYQGQATCMGACCRDGETSVIPPACRPVPACRPGQQPYSSPLACCKQCLPNGGAPRPSVHVGVQVPLKECEGNRPYRIYMADPKKMDAFAYSIVNRDQVHVLQWNSTGIHSLKMSRAAFAALPQRPFFLYRGRSTPESVSDLVNNPVKVRRVAECQQSCAQMVVSMLDPSMQPIQLEDC